MGQTERPVVGCYLLSGQPFVSAGSMAPADVWMFPRDRLGTSLSL